MAMANRTVEPAETEIVCSVCIANYNGREIIDACLRSVLDQQCDFRYEIIVHDDASTDGSADHIAANYPELKLIRSKGNVGYCLSNNRMAAQAQGRYLLLLNNDATLYPDALRTLHTEAMRQSVSAILTLPQYNARTGALVDLGLRLDPFLNPVPNLDPGQPDVSMVHGACLWMPTPLWHEIGGFPEWFHMLAEDMYLCCVARLWGGKVIVTARSGYRHHIGYSIGGGKPQGAQLVTTYRRRALSERNKNFVMLLCYPLPALLIALPLHAVLLLMEGVALALIRFNREIFTCIYLTSLTSLWKHRRILSASRRVLQKKRVIGTVTFFSTYTWLPHKLRLLLRHGVPKIHG